MAKKRRFKLWHWIVLFLFLIMLIGFFLKRSKNDNDKKVFVERASLQTIIEEVNASGKIFPITEVKISSDVSGEIIDLFVQEGDSVKTGQILARINPESITATVARGQATLDNAKAQRAIARAQLESNKAQEQQILAQCTNAKKILDRNTQLKNDGIISIAEWEQSKTNLSALQANLSAARSNIKSSQESVKASEYNIKSAKATLDELKSNLKKTTISAPTPGIVSLLSIQKGERVVGTSQMSGTEIMRIANLEQMEVQVEVSENNIAKIKVNNPVTIEVDAFPNKTFTGQVTQIANTASNAATATSKSALLNSAQITNFIVKIAIDVASSKKVLFRPGMSASVNIETDRKQDILTVPIQAVTARETDDAINEVVFRVKADTIEQQIVKTGIQNTKYIAISEGVQEGDTIITGPYGLLSKTLESGMQVNYSFKKKHEKK